MSYSEQDRRVDEIDDMMKIVREFAGRRYGTRGVLAKSAGVSRATVYRLDDPDWNPDVTTLRKLVYAVQQISADWPIPRNQD